jgi:hypothetical protein
MAADDRRLFLPGGSVRGEEAEAVRDVLAPVAPVAAVDAQRRQPVTVAVHRRSSADSATTSPNRFVVASYVTAAIP